MIKYVKGDLFSYINKEKYTQNIIIPHVCNNIGGWGRGFVIPLAKKYPETKIKYQNWYMDGYYFGIPFALGEIQSIFCSSSNENVWVCNMIAQTGITSPNNLKPIKYDALYKCMKELRNTYNRVSSNGANFSIHCPKFGCGLAGGKWEVVEEFIEDIWYDLNVTVYELE